MRYRVEVVEDDSWVTVDFIDVEPGCCDSDLEHALNSIRVHAPMGADAVVWGRGTAVINDGCGFPVVALEAT